DVDRHDRGRRATRYYYQPWELLYPEISLDRVCEILYRVAPDFAAEFFYPPFSGLEESPAWLRRRTLVAVERCVLDSYMSNGLAQNDGKVSDWHEREFDVFVALWCLYREAELRRDIGRVLYYRETISHYRKMAEHPVFCHVYDEYRAL